MLVYLSFVGSVMIVIEFGKNDHSSIPTIVIGRGLESLDARTVPQTKLNYGENKNKNNKLVYEARG
jgi:hypothetical protein